MDAATTRLRHDRVYREGFDGCSARATDPASLPDALASVRKVFLYAHAETATEFARAARNADVKHVVLLSSASVHQPDAQSNPIARQHLAVERALDEADPVAGIEVEFARLHERQYGHTMTDPVEVTTLRLRATGSVDKPKLPELAPRSSGAPQPDGTREVYRSADQPAARYALYTRETLLAGDEITGPAVIAEHTATTVIHAGDHLRVGAHGELLITVGGVR